ncbi:MAG: hypothetical protein WC981_02820 [Candidatus Dojkabacteria bacterium]
MSLPNFKPTFTEKFNQTYLSHVLGISPQAVSKHFKDKGNEWLFEEEYVEYLLSYFPNTKKDKEFILIYIEELKKRGHNVSDYSDLSNVVKRCVGYLNKSKAQLAESEINEDLVKSLYKIQTAINILKS